MSEKVFILVAHCVTLGQDRAVKETGSLKSLSLLCKL
jgi:hypothetical protein